MEELLSVLAELGLELHPDRISAAASALEALGSPDRFEPIRAGFGPNADKNLMERLERVWRNCPEVSPREAAFALRGASAAASQGERRGTMELVWTGPSTGLVPVRRTEQVLREVIATAKRRLFIVSFVAHGVDSIIRSLREALERRVQIGVLLESSDKHGGRVSHDSVRAVKELLPAVNVFVWSTESKRQAGLPPGAVHAKCAVADGELAFITSANLTSAALGSNMELGILVRGGSLPADLHGHLDALIARRIIESVEAEPGT